MERPHKTPWSNWMYPPKNVSLFEYMSIAGRSKFKTVYRYRQYFAVIIPMYFAGLYFTGTTWMKQRKNGGKFYVDLKNDEGSFLMGPPCPKAKAEREYNRLMHAPHM